MKFLILFNIAAATGLLTLIITRTYRKNRAAILFYITDSLFLIAIYYFLIDLFHIFAYFSLLFLYVFILSVMRMSPKSRAFMANDSEVVPDRRRSEYPAYHGYIDTVIKYASLGHLAVSSILVSVFLMPDIYHSIPIAAGVGIALFSFLNLNLAVRRKKIMPFDRVLLYVIYIKVFVLAISLNPFFVFLTVGR